MDLFKLDKYDKYFVAFILIIITLFNIGKCFASEVEDVELQQMVGLFISSSSNYFSSLSNAQIGYFQAEPGYRYTITATSTTSRIVVTSSDSPNVNVTYDILYVMNDPSIDNTYTFISNDNNYISLNGNPTIYTVTREKIEDMNGAVGSLVDNVGVSQLWNVFEGGIDFVGVVVLVAFGLFLIVLLVKKISKGKADF